MAYTHPDFGKMPAFSLARPILQSWVNGFALQRPTHKNALVNSAERFLTYESPVLLVPRGIHEEQAIGWCQDLSY
jgi:hypothetical protein